MNRESTGPPHANSRRKPQPDRLPGGPNSSPPSPDVAIQDVSSWVLRIGVVSSVAIMLIGTVVSFLRHSVSIQDMEGARFKSDFGVIWHGVLAGSGRSIIEVGILLLVLTPIMRVAASMFLFLFEEHDWFYTLVTFAVLTLTLVSLLLLR